MIMPPLRGRGICRERRRPAADCTWARPRAGAARSSEVGRDTLEQDGLSRLRDAGSCVSRDRRKSATAGIVTQLCGGNALTWLQVKVSSRCMRCAPACVPPNAT